MIGKDEPDSVRSEPPYAIRRAQKPLPPAMDAAGLARHLSIAELQVRKHIQHCGLVQMVGSHPMQLCCLRLPCKLCRLSDFFDSINISHPSLLGWLGVVGAD